MARSATREQNADPIAVQPQKAMRTILASIFINAILAWLFISALHWGSCSAGLATVSARALMLIRQIRFFSDRSNLVHMLAAGISM